ncbi:hypothetical protein Prudu_011418 [Prunus dulcis]|uniref:Berberine/berberine-like domain-containing protein n=1 Tax=Prunus dulcis TaxID=3755 RepID=A0A4Y1RB78_PRUDU|nr:hypothetical protein Prudu_011418 [Prunus dulcis]
MKLSWTTSDPVLTGFLQCLPKQPQSAYPIFEAIYTRENTLFQSVLLGYIRNSRYSTLATPKPLAIVTALHESHVQATVICAKQHGLQIRTRSVAMIMRAYHTYPMSPLSFLTCLIFDPLILMSRMRALGFRLGLLSVNFIMKLQIKVRFMGSSGSLSNCVELVVTLVVARSGGASFGVILSWKIRLLPVPASVTVFNVKRTWEQGALNVIYKWQHVAPKLLDEIFIRAITRLKNSTEGKKTVEVSFVGLFLGRRDKLVPLMNESFPELGLQLKDCFEMSWVESTLFWADQPIGAPVNFLLNRPQGPPNFFKSKSDYVKEPIPKQGIESIWQMMLKMDKVLMQWSPYGGRMSMIPEWETPFPHRDGNLFLIQYVTYWVEEGAETLKQHLGFVRKLYEGMTLYVSKSPREAFQNYRDLDIGANRQNHTEFETAKVYGSKYFKGNFDRLIRVKSWLILIIF